MKLKQAAIAGFVLAFAGLLGYLWFTPGGGALQAPSVAFADLDGQRLTLDELRGRPVLVTFWATTCPSCVKEIPHLIDLHRELAPRGLTVIGVAMAYDPPPQVRELVERREIPYTIALDRDGSAAKAFGDVSLTPTTFLIDPQGRIVQRTLGEVDMEVLKRRIEGMLQRAQGGTHAVG